MAWALFPPEVSKPQLDSNRYILSGRARNASLEGRVERFHAEDFGAAERGDLPEKGWEEQILLMLRWFEKSARRGQWITPESTRDYPVAFCHDGSEWATLLWDVVKEKWLDNEGLQFRINLAGRRRLAELSATPAGANQTKEPDVSNLPAYFARYEAEVAQFVKCLGRFKGTRAYLPITWLYNHSR